MPDELLRPNSDNALAQNGSQPPVTNKPVRVKKRRGLGEWLTSLVTRNGDGFLHHVLYGIIAPRTVDAVEDILNDGINRMLHPQNGRYPEAPRRNYQNPGDVVSYRYNEMFDSSSSSVRYEPSRYDRTPDPRTIEFPTSAIARLVLEDMKECIYQERFCTIQQFYEFARRETEKANMGVINIVPNFTDTYYGWSNLEGVRPDMTYNGKYTLRLPPTERA